MFLLNGFTYQEQWSWQVVSRSVMLYWLQMLWFYLVFIYISIEFLVDGEILSLELSAQAFRCKNLYPFIFCHPIILPWYHYYDLAPWWVNQWTFWFLVISLTMLSTEKSATTVYEIKARGLFPMVVHLCQTHLWFTPEHKTEANSENFITSPYVEIFLWANKQTNVLQRPLYRLYLDCVLLNLGTGCLGFSF